ncbi:acyl-CoA dehydrogenase family protein [Sphingomonas sp.]|uniref:acyl-CoA dehydrogenase family protein n=1 Tax=Sphingomonas sp. TaxID=28214 RepID=UPI003B3ABE26
MTAASPTDFAIALNDLIASIPARSAEFEAMRRIPDDVIAQMRSAGIFKMFVPEEHNGLELDLPEIIDAVRRLSCADASVGWTTMIGAGSALFATMLPREAFQSIYGVDENAIIAGSTQLLGVIEQRGGVWHGKGRWPFASGCHHATWMLGFCRLVTEGDEAGPHKVRVVVLPADRWTILDTWHVPGLKGSGSDDIVLNTPLDPEIDIFDIEGTQPWQKGPLYAGVPHMIALLHAAVSLGIAQGALNDLLAIAASGRRQQRAAAPMRDTEAFQRDLGKVHADIRAAEAVLQNQTQSHWQHAQNQTLATDALLVEGSQSAIWVVNQCRRAVDELFALGGSAVMYDSSPLQRRLRDIHMAAQHNLMQPRHFVKSGKLLVETFESAGVH